MFQTVEEIAASSPKDSEPERGSEGESMMIEVFHMLAAEIAMGEAKSPRDRAWTALNSLLGAFNISAETTVLSLEWFDSQFPYDGWTPIRFPRITQATYRDYRKRARAAICRANGDTQKRQLLKSQWDQWRELELELGKLPFFCMTPQELIPFTSALPRRARELDLQPHDITNDVLRAMVADAPNGDRNSLRNAARSIFKLQNDPATAKIVGNFFPNQIEPVRAEARHSLELPEHFCAEIDTMAEKSSRMHFIRIKNYWEYYSEGTRNNHRTILRRIVSALINTGKLKTTANTCRSALEDQEAVRVALDFVHTRAWSGDLAWSTAKITATHLPCILERNGIELPELRSMIGEVKEFRSRTVGGEMPEDAKEFCRALIERPNFLADFGTAHLALRTEADRIIWNARKDRRHLTANERAHVRQLGTVALFCAIETGGAPIRVENFLEMPISGDSPWAHRSSKTEFRISIPAEYTKNNKAINVTMCPDELGCFDAILWFLDEIRPYFFATQDVGLETARRMADRCEYLVPAVQSDNKPLNYRSFSDWFARWMRDVAGIVCKPHNFRHGQASVLYFGFPERIDVIAERLGDTIETVVRTYAWVHSEIVMRQGQEMLVDMIRNSRKGAVQR